jgi:hypothetical protein
MTPPKLESAPGIRWRKLRNKWEARWQARGDIVKKGFRPKSMQVWSGHLEQLDAANIAYIQHRAQSLQDEMLVYGRGGVPDIGPLTATIAGIADAYRTDPDSRYHKARYVSRRYYDTLLERIIRDHGSEMLGDIKARNVIRWHEQWKEASGLSMASALVRMLRGIISFGSSMLEDPECIRLKAALSDQRFEMAKPRTERLTAEMAIAIRAEAHKKGLPSIALAQAIQFELMLRQKDVLGEWVPLEEPGPLTDQTHGQFKWVRGIRWEEIDEHLTLRHVTSKRGKPIEISLLAAPMVMEELKRIERKASGPVIMCELTGRPWKAMNFRFHWRTCADRAGVPKSVRNMDSRAGAISEATDAGAELEHVRHAATHSDISMTQRYSRGSTEKVANVQRLRTEHRNKAKRDG